MVYFSKVITNPSMKINQSKNFKSRKPFEYNYTKITSDFRFFFLFSFLFYVLPINTKRAKNHNYNANCCNLSHKVIIKHYFKLKGSVIFRQEPQSFTALIRRCGVHDNFPVRLSTGCRSGFSVSRVVPSYYLERLCAEPAYLSR